MGTQATDPMIDDSEPVDLTSLHPAERALIETALADADQGRWVDHSIIKADIAAMRARVRLGRAAERAGRN